MGFIINVDGQVYIGRFMRTETRQTEKYGVAHDLILQVKNWDGTTREVSFMYDTADRQTGEKLPIVDHLAKVSPGDTIALRFKSFPTKDGKGVYSRAVAVSEPLQAAPALASAAA